MSEAHLRRAARQLQEHLDAQEVTPNVTPLDCGEEKVKEEEQQTADV
jgi:hypothetical protein